MKYKEGQRVKLIETEDCPEQIGTVIEANQMRWGESYIVELDKPEDKDDDGVREVSLDDMEAI